MEDDASKSSPPPSQPPLLKGLGKVARYIKLYGGLGRKIGPYDASITQATVKEERTQLHDSEEKYPQSSVHYISYECAGIRLMFEYLREREYWTMRDIADGKDKQAALDEIQAMLIFLVTNVREYKK